MNKGDVKEVIMATGNLEIKFEDVNEVLTYIGNCQTYYENICDDLRDYKSRVESLDSNTSYYNKNLWAAGSNIDSQITVYESKVTALDTVVESINQFVIDAEDYENKIANHLEENFGEFCEANDIEVEDPDDRNWWDDVCDWVSDVYDKYKYIIDFVVDAIIVVVAVVSFVVAVSALTLVTGGAFAAFMAGAAVFAAGFALYEAGADFVCSSMALYQYATGDEEEAARLKSIRDNGAGEYAFVNTLEFFGCPPKVAKTIYGGIKITAAVASIANCVYSVSGAVKKVWNKDISIFKNIGNSLKTIGSELLKPSFKKDINTDGEDFAYLMWTINYDMEFEQLKNLYKLNNTFSNMSTLFLNMRNSDGIADFIHDEFWSFTGASDIFSGGSDIHDVVID